MTNVERVFGVPRVLLPVIHPVNWQAAIENVKMVVDNGGKGIFLINQGMDIPRLLELVTEVRRIYPALWLGINVLGYSPTMAIQKVASVGVDGLWTDNADIEEGEKEQPEARSFCIERGIARWEGLYFGGVAFKYQRPVTDVGSAARTAVPYMDVICTSGPGTGQEADPGKIVAMREAVGPKVSIALASGVTAENVAAYLPTVNAFLVGTGIERVLGYLDVKKLRALQSAIANYRVSPSPDASVA